MVGFPSDEGAECQSSAAGVGTGFFNTIGLAAIWGFKEPPVNVRSANLAATR